MEDAVCANVERMEQLCGCPSPAWPARRSHVSLSVHLKARINRVQAAAAQLGDPAAVAATGRAAAASVAWHAALHPHGAAVATAVAPAAERPSSAPALAASSSSGVKGASTPSIPSTTLVGAAAVGVVGIGAVVLFFRARRKLPPI